MALEDPADDEDGAACLGASVVFHVASSPRQLRWSFSTWDGCLCDAGYDNNYTFNVCCSVPTPSGQEVGLLLLARFPFVSPLRPGWRLKIDLIIIIFYNL